MEKTNLCRPKTHRMMEMAISLFLMRLGIVYPFVGGCMLELATKEDHKTLTLDNSRKDWKVVAYLLNDDVDFVDVELLYTGSVNPGVAARGRVDYCMPTSNKFGQINVSTDTRVPYQLNNIRHEFYKQLNYNRTTTW